MPDDDILFMYNCIDNNEFNKLYSFARIDQFCIMHINCTCLVANFDVVLKLLSILSLFNVVILTK